MRFGNAIGFTVLFAVVFGVIFGGIALLRAIRRKHAREARSWQEFADSIAAAPDATGAVLSKLEEEARKHRRRRRIGQIAIMCYSVMTLTMLGGYLALSLVSGDWTKHLDMLKFLGQFGGFAGFTGLLAINQIQRQGVSALAQMEDVRGVGPLAEALTYQEKDVRAVAERALVDLLPRVQASDAHLLDSTQRASLNRALKGKNEALVLAILKAYQQVGDESAVPVVTDLADSDSASAAVRDAAGECLPFLHQSAEREKLRLTLLRPSSAAGEEADVLLRPAQGAPDGDSANLLRASDVPGESPAHPIAISPQRLNARTPESPALAEPAELSTAVKE